MSDSFATPWTVAHQAPLSMRFSRQEYWSRLPFPTPGDLPDPRMESTFPAPPALAGRFFTTVPPGKSPQMLEVSNIVGSSEHLIFWTNKCVCLWKLCIEGNSSFTEKGKQFFLPLTAFVFYNHIHGREMLDIFVHKLLVLVVFSTGLIAFMELFAQTSITVELLRTSLFLLQGSWFWQVSWVLQSMCLVSALMAFSLWL